MAVKARQHFKRMRGGANAQLMLADDDRSYVVKFRNNPQHQRILVNELVAGVVLDYLGLPSCAWEIVDVPERLIRETPELYLEFGKERRAPEAGLHFGSRYPVDPFRQAVYDYVPISLLKVLANLRSFAGMLAFDKWASNANGRQAVFFRAPAKEWAPDDLFPAGAPSPGSLVYVVNFIDHGFAFNAQHWDFSDSPEIGLYPRREVYEHVTGFDDFEPWLTRIAELPAQVLDDAYGQTPPHWYDSQVDHLEALLETLYRRRSSAPDLLRKAKQARRDPFPNWTANSSPGLTRAGG